MRKSGDRGAYCALFLLTAGVSGLTGCGSGSPETDEISSAIYNGTTVAFTQNLGAIAVFHNWPRPCSGTLIRRQWVLTARHCVTTDGQVWGPLVNPSDLGVNNSMSPGLTAQWFAPIDRIVPHFDRDLALLHIYAPQNNEPDLLNVTVAGFANKPLSQMPGSTIRIMGYGRSVEGGAAEVENGTTGAGTLRQADVTARALTAQESISFDTKRFFAYSPNASGQITWRGDSGGPAFLVNDIFNRTLAGVAGVHTNSDLAKAFDLSVDAARRWIKQSSYGRGNMVWNGGREAHLALVGGPTWNTTPLLFVSREEDAPFFIENNQWSPTFATMARTTNVKPLTGDFDGDSVTDIALLGSGRSTLAIDYNPMTPSVLDNSSSLVTLASQATANKLTTGDMDGDGKTDFVILRGTEVHVGYATLTGSSQVFDFQRLLVDLSSKASNLTAAGTQLLSGDFDGDGRDDAMVLGNSSTVVTTCFSGGYLYETVCNNYASDLAGWAQTSGTKTVVGDFNGDGRDDVAVTGGVGWGAIRVALSTGNGFTTLINPVDNSTGGNTVAMFSDWSRVSNVQMVAGDYDGDGFDDIALAGGIGWGSVPIAFSFFMNNTLSFQVTNNGTVFAAWAQEPGAKVISGR